MPIEQGEHPKIPGGGNRGTYAQRAQIVPECTKLVTKMKARRMIRDASKLRNSVNSEHIEEVRRLAPGAPVLVYREKEGWAHNLAKVDCNEVNVVLPSGSIAAFGIHNVRPVAMDTTGDVTTGSEMDPQLVQAEQRKKFRT